MSNLRARQSPHPYRSYRRTPAAALRLSTSELVARFGAFGAKPTKEPQWNTPK